MRIVKLVVLAIIVFLIVAQFFRIDKTNPPVETEINLPSPVKEAITRSCYQCHSNETVWPWYSNVAPASWLVAHDVHKGRRELNFSVWGSYVPARRLKKLHEITKEIADGDMPPVYYVYPMHMDARLSAEDRQAINDWVASESAAVARADAHTASPAR